MTEIKMLVVVCSYGFGFLYALMRVAEQVIESLALDKSIFIQLVT